MPPSRSGWCAPSAQIRDRRLTLEMPRGAELKRRLDSVLDILYFMFNEGYTAHEGEDLIRQDLCMEALRLGRLVAASSMAAPRVDALVALMALRSGAAAGARGRIGRPGAAGSAGSQPLGSSSLIALGFHHFDRSMAGDEVSEYPRAGGDRGHARARRRIRRRSIGR